MSAAERETSAPSPELVELQRTLYTSRNPTRRWLHTSRRDRIEAAVRRLAAERSTSRALEVGPGSGIYLPMLCELYDRVTGSDVEREYLDHIPAEVASAPNLELVSDDITRTDLQSGFDLILCSEVIEHIPDVESAIRSMAGLLAPGGSLVLSTPQPWSPLEIAGRVAFWPGIISLVRLVYREPILPTGHTSLTSAKKLGRMIEGSGLTVNSRDLSGMYVPLIAEFGGQFALRVEKELEARMAGGLLKGALWTQYWIAEAPSR